MDKFGLSGPCICLLLYMGLKLFACFWEFEVWSAGALPKRRRLVHAVRNHALLPGPACVLTSDWVRLPPSAFAAEDVNAWPYSVGILVKWVTFLAILHWPAAGADFAVGEVSYVEMLLIEPERCTDRGLTCNDEG